MPEGYTHIRTARRAAQAGGIRIRDAASFGCGANGPDMLFSYRVWMKSSKRGEDLPKIGGRLHDENTGVFLLSLLKNAKTESQRDYVLGFLSHYATDCTVHPFIVMLCQEGQPYAMEGGHGYSEIAIDSFLHKKDTGNPCVPANDNAPKLAGEALSGNAELLQSGIRDALGLKISKQALMDTFVHTRFLRHFFISPLHILYGIYRLAEPAFGRKGFITCHVTPAKLRPLPCPWVNPFTGKQDNADLDALLRRAEELSLTYMNGALEYWQGSRSLEEMGELLGSSSYLSGLPDERSDPHRHFSKKA